MDPPTFLRHGDRVRISVEGLGTLVNPVTDIQIVPVMAGCETEALQVGTQVQIGGNPALAG